MRIERYIVFRAAAIIFMAMLSIGASAQSSEALPFTRITRDPVSLAMGGTSVTRTSDISYASFSNAAAIPFSDNTLDVSAGYLGWQPSASPVQNVSAGAAWNAGGKFGVAAGFSYGMCQEYEIMNASGQAAGSFSPSEIQANVGLAWKFLPFISVGANVKYLGNTLAEGQSFSAVSSDIFLMSEFSSFRAALGVSSLGSKVKSASGARFSLPASATLGLGYGDVFGQRHGVEVLVDADCYFSGAFSAAAGASYMYNGMVSVRAGYRYGGDSVIPSFASVGAGVKLFGVHLDAAYLIASGDSPLKNTFCIGIGYSF